MEEPLVMTLKPFPGARAVLSMLAACARGAPKQLNQTDQDITNIDRKVMTVG